MIRSTSDPILFRPSSPRHSPFHVPLTGTTMSTSDRNAIKERRAKEVEGIFNKLLHDPPRRIGHVRAEFSVTKALEDLIFWSKLYVNHGLRFLGDKTFEEYVAPGLVEIEGWTWEHSGCPDLEDTSLVRREFIFQKVRGECSFCTNLTQPLSANAMNDQAIEMRAKEVEREFTKLTYVPTYQIQSKRISLCARPTLQALIDLGTGYIRNGLLPSNCSSLEESVAPFFEHLKYYKVLNSACLLYVLQNISLPVPLMRHFSLDYNLTLPSSLNFIGDPAKVARAKEVEYILNQSFPVFLGQRHFIPDDDFQARKDLIDVAVDYIIHGDFPSKSSSSEECAAPLLTAIKNRDPYFAPLHVMEDILSKLAQQQNQEHVALEGNTPHNRTMLKGLKYVWGYVGGALVAVGQKGSDIEVPMVAILGGWEGTSKVTMTPTRDHQTMDLIKSFTKLDMFKMGCTAFSVTCMTSSKMFGPISGHARSPCVAVASEARYKLLRNFVCGAGIISSLTALFMKTFEPLPLPYLGIGACVCIVPVMAAAVYKA